MMKRRLTHEDVSPSPEGSDVDLSGESPVSAASLVRLAAKEFHKHLAEFVKGTRKELKKRKLSYGEK